MCRISVLRQISEPCNNVVFTRDSAGFHDMHWTNEVLPTYPNLPLQNIKKSFPKGQKINKTKTAHSKSTKKEWYCQKLTQELENLMATPSFYQESPKSAPRAPKSAWERSRALQESRTSVPRGLGRGPRALQEASQGAAKSSWRTQRAPKSPNRPKYPSRAHQTVNPLLHTIFYRTKQKFTEFQC